MSLTKPSIGSTTSASMLFVSFVFTSRITIPDSRSPSDEHIVELVEWKQHRLPGLDRRLNFRDRRTVRAILVASMHQRHRRRAVTKLMTPVESGIASTDDHDLLSAEFFRIDDVVEDSPAVPWLGACLGQAAR